MPEPSNVLLYAFLGLLGLTIVAALKGIKTSEAHRDAVHATKVAAGLSLWLLITGGLALAGITENFDKRPPPLMVIVFIGFIITIIVARGRVGTQVALTLPVASLIAFQSFRFPLELLLHRAYLDGLMPIQMCFEGNNFDILTGIGGAGIGGYYLATKQEVPKAVAWAFNLMGIGLLVTIAGIAIASMPVFAAFGDEHINTWVGYFPFIWLPAIFVTFALFGHIVLTKRLLLLPPQPE